MTIRAAAILVWILLGSVPVVSAMPKPPARAAVQKHGQTAFYSGNVYLSAHEDTVKLKALGFREFVFDSRTFASVKYKASWPASAVELPMPDYLNGIEYDVSSSAASDQEEMFTAPGLRMGSGDRMTDPDVARQILSQTENIIQCHSRPANGRPDTVIADREYVRGCVILRSLADSAALLPYGFFGFDPDPRGGTTYDNSRVGLPVIKFYSYHAYWPIDVPVSLLPQCVNGLQADRMRRGTGVVVIKRKMPLE